MNDIEIEVGKFSKDLPKLNIHFDWIHMTLCKMINLPLRYVLRSIE